MEQPIISGYAPVNGLDMYYEIHGEGNIPLVLIHGGGSTIETVFSNILPFFSLHRKVIAMELQAHGRTTDRDAPESFEQDADDVAALLQYLEIDKAHFFGFSNGGTTTIQIAIRHPQIVHKIVTLSAITRRDGFINGFFDGFENVTLDSMPEPLRTGFLKVTPDEDRLEIMFRKDVARMMSFRDIPDESLQNIKAKALIIVSDQDAILAEHTVAISKLIPGARLLILPGLHGACIGDVCTYEQGDKLPEITAYLIESFLKDQAST